MATSTDARQLFGDRVTWLNGKPLNHITFQRLVDEGILTPFDQLGRGTRLFDERDVIAVIKLMPKERPKNRHGIINYLKERVKNRKAAKK